MRSPEHYEQYVIVELCISWTWFCCYNSFQTSGFMLSTSVWFRWRRLAFCACPPSSQKGRMGLSSVLCAYQSSSSTTNWEHIFFMGPLYGNKMLKQSVHCKLSDIKSYRYTMLSFYPNFAFSLFLIQHVKDLWMCIICICCHKVERAPLSSAAPYTAKLIFPLIWIHVPNMIKSPRAKGYRGYVHIHLSTV